MKIRTCNIPEQTVGAAPAAISKMVSDVGMRAKASCRKTRSRKNFACA